MHEYKTFKIGDLFDIRGNPQLNKNSFKFSEDGEYPYFTRTLDNNGILGYVDYLNDDYIIKGNSVAVGMLGMKFFYMGSDFYSGQFTKTIFANFEGFNKKIALYFIAIFNKNSEFYQSELVRNFEKIFLETKIQLPITDRGFLDFDYMESYITQIENKYISTLENRRNFYLKSYLTVAEIDEYELSDEDKKVLLLEPQWSEFRVGDLFDTIKCGKRIKSLDRIDGDLPFITAGVNERGFSSYIGNSEADIFPENSLTIDMFGTVFYRSYEYGADDHVAVLYNETSKYNKYVLLYLGTCIEKSIEGKFSYSKNFYASDAPDVVVSLPILKNANPDFIYMESYIKVQQKLAIANIVRKFDYQIRITTHLVKNKI